MQGPVTTTDYVYVSNDDNPLIINIVLAGCADVPYKHFPEGGIILSGSANICKVLCVLCRYSPGSIVFLRQKAAKGILEKIFIARVDYKTIPRNCASIGAGALCTYFDKLHEIYDEEELVDNYDALILAKSFYEFQLVQSESILQNGKPPILLNPSMPVSSAPPTAPVVPSTPPSVPVSPPPVPPVCPACPTLPPSPPTTVTSLTVSELDGDPYVTNVVHLVFNGLDEIVTDGGSGKVFINLPAAPPPLGGPFVVSGTMFYTGRTSQSNINYETFAGDSHTYITDDVVGIRLVEPSFRYGSVGFLTLRLNGEAIAQINLGGNFNENNRSVGQDISAYNIAASGFNLSSGVCTFIGSVTGKGNMAILSVTPTSGVDIDMFQEGIVEINFTDPTAWRQGYNYVTLEHSGCPECPLQEETFKLFNDTDIGADPSVINQDLTVGALVAKQLSGVSYVGAGSTLLLEFDGLDLFDNVYHVSNAPVVYDDAPSSWGIPTTSLLYTDVFVSNVSTPPDIGETMEVDLPITVPANLEEDDARISITPRDPYGSYTTVTTPSNNIMINSFGNQSTILTEFFRDERYRIPLDVDFDIVPAEPYVPGLWDSSVSLVSGASGYTTSLQVYDTDESIKNTLVHPKTDYTSRLPSPNVNYTSLAGGTGFRYVRIFQDDNETDRFNGILSVPGITNTDLGTNVKIYIKVPGRTVWLDASAPFVLGTFASNAPVGNTDFIEGCRINSGVNSPNLNGRIEFSLGSIGTVASSGRAIYVMIEYLNASIPNLINGSGSGFSIMNW